MHRRDQRHHARRRASWRVTEVSKHSAKKRFTEEQIIKALKEVDGEAEVRDVCRRLGVSEQSFYRWRRRFGGLEVSRAKRLRELETRTDGSADDGGSDAGQSDPAGRHFCVRFKNALAVGPSSAATSRGTPCGSSHRWPRASTPIPRARPADASEPLGVEMQHVPWCACSYRWIGSIEWSIQSLPILVPRHTRCGLPTARERPSLAFRSIDQ